MDHGTNGIPSDIDYMDEAMDSIAQSNPGDDQPSQRTAESVPADVQMNGVTTELGSDVEEGFFEDDAGSEDSTESLSPSAFEHDYIHGRTYEPSGRYMLPDDEDEQDRCDALYHGIMRVTDEKLYHAPVSVLRYVLDVGTGTGIWAIDMDKHPACVVVSIDISPIQPTIVPPNCKFQRANAEDIWDYNYDFDLVHFSTMNDVSLRDWVHCYQQAYDVLSPGGWIECLEISYRRTSADNSIPADSKITEWENYWVEAMGKVGLKGNCDPELIERQMAAVGFVNIVRLDFYLPIGRWPSTARLRDAGTAGLLNAKCGMHSMSVKPFTENLGWSIRHVDRLLQECDVELQRRDIHASWPIYVIYGQRPEVRRREEEGKEAEDFEMT